MEPDLSSHTKQAQARGVFADEILPVEIRGKVASNDDPIRAGVTVESLAGLKPVFPQWGEGSTTAGNASGVGDGAAICILTTRARAEKEGMEILGKWVGSAVVGQCSALFAFCNCIDCGIQVLSPSIWAFLR